MPGIETWAPDLTDNNNGLDRSPNFFLVIFSITLISLLAKLVIFFMIFLLFL